MAKENYRSIERKIWQDQKIKALSLEGKLLFLYLITNIHSHYSGIYYLPPEIIKRELPPLTMALIDKAIQELEKSELIIYDADNSVFWVVNMTDYQCKGNSKSLVQGIANHLEQLETTLTDRFTEHYKTLLYTL